MNQFEVQSGTIRVFRYAVSVPETKRRPAMTLYCSNAEEANALASVCPGCEITELDCSSVQWMDGIEVEDFNEALTIAQMGQATYEAQKRAKTLQSPEQLRADLDFLSAITGVELE